MHIRNRHTHKPQHPHAAKKKKRTESILLEDVNSSYSRNTVSKQRFELEKLDEINMLKDELMKEKERTKIYSKLEQKIKLLEQEFHLTIENNTTGMLKEKIGKLQNEIDSFVRDKEDKEERFKQEQNNKNIKIEELLVTIENQEKEIARIRCDYDTQRQKLNEFQTNSDRMIQEKNELIQTIKLEKDKAHENNELQTEIDKMRNECLRNSNELRRVKEKEKQTKGKYKKVYLEMKTIIETNTQTISQLKRENAIYNKLKEKCQICKQEAQEQFVQNEVLSKTLKKENKKAKSNAEEYYQLNACLLELRKHHFEEKESLRTLFDKKQYDTYIRHQKQIVQLLEETQKCINDLVRNEEKQNMQGDTETCHNLQIEIDRLEKDNKTLLEKLELERRHLQEKEEYYIKIRSETEKILEEKEIEINNLKVKYKEHEQAGHDVLDKNKQLLLDTEKLRDALQHENAKVKRLEDERDLVREELQIFQNEQFEKMQKLRVVNDIQRNVDNCYENQKLKNELSLFRVKYIEIKTELTAQQEHARTTEQENDERLQTLREEIRLVKRDYNLLDLHNKQLSVDLNHERDIANQYKHDLDINSDEVQKLKRQQEVMNQTTIKLNKDLSQQQDNARKQEESNSKLIQDLQKLREELQQVKNENIHLFEVINSKGKHVNDNKLIDFRQIVHDTCEQTEFLIRETEKAKQIIETYEKYISQKKAMFETQKHEFAPTNLRNTCFEFEGRNGNPNADARLEDKYLTEKEPQHELTQVLDRLTTAQRDFDDTQSRLSRAMADIFVENNPDKSNLSDPNCPIRISQRYQDLYKTKWADAYEIVNRMTGNKEKTITTLVRILMKTMTFCTSMSDQLIASLSETLSKGKDHSASTMRQLICERKSSAENYGKELYMEYWMKLNQSQSKGAKMATMIPEFVKECFEICWLMALVQDPPMIFDPEIHHDEDFNKNHYTAYAAKSGSRIDYIVWPVMLLHRNGPVLCKGVAAESH